MRKPDILKAMERGEALVYDPDAGRSGSGRRLRLVKVLRPIEEYEVFTEEEARAIKSFPKEFLSHWQYKNLNLSGDKVRAKRAGWLVEEVKLPRDFLAYCMAGSPGERRFVESRYLVGTQEKHRDRALSELDERRRLRSAKQEWGDLQDRAAGLPLGISLNIDANGATLRMRLSPDTADVARALDPADPVKASAETRFAFKFTALDVLDAVREAVEGERFGEPETAGRAVAYLEAGYDVRVSVQDNRRAMEAALTAAEAAHEEGRLS